MSNFQYCFLVWDFLNAQLLNKIENLEKRALRLLLNDYGSTYEDLLEKSAITHKISETNSSFRVK